ncbi:MAG: hypothetical protein KJ072_25750 [Verrucomicrobia bacterium]|nr:hypothetical protein [Verrucomicrobiota bacterium]
MKGDFHEGLQSAKRDPVDAQEQDFDWRKLYQQLSEDAADGDQDKRLAETVTRLLQMLVPLSNRRIRIESIGLNLVALAWVLNPGYFDGAPSLRQLAKRCGVEPAALARHTAHYSRLIRWRNRGQRHAWNWRDEQRSRLKR